MISRFAVAASLALALAACGSSNEPTSTSTETVTSTTAATPEAVPAEAAPSAAPSTEAATPSPTPTPSATPTAKASASASSKMSDAATGAAASMPTAFNQCTACHSTQAGKTIIGPSLAHVYGRKAGTLAGFQYSQAMKDSGLTWNSATLDRYLTDPTSVVPGTLMGFAGLKDEEQREAVIRYLKTL